MRSLLSLALVLTFSVTLHAATQTVTLKPGWNSVWLELAPDDPTPSVVFSGIPVQQAWCYFPKDRPVEFIDNPDSGLWNRDAWSVFIPSGAEAFLTNLFAIQANRPLLVKLGGSVNVTLTINGTPDYRAPKWKAKSFNLAGFPVDPTTGGGGVGSFFFNEPALKNGAKYKLSTAGTWVPMVSSDIIRSGEAYWLYADSDTTFNGPLSITGDFDFGTARERSSLTITNPNAWSVTAAVGNAAGFPLFERTTDSLGNVVWTAVNTLSKTLAAGTSVTLDFGVQRRSLAADLDQLLTISGGGARIRVPLRVRKSADAALGGGYAGLWVGNVTINEVAEVNVNPLLTKPTPAELSYRVIVHVNAAGQAKLLKSVIMMWKDGVASTTVGVPDVPGRHVLVTDDTRIVDFKGATLKDGRQFGHRISTVAYDFPANEFALTGSFGISATAHLVIAKDSPTHPYRHKYHPDHDGLDAQYHALPSGITADQEETWDIARDWVLTFQSDPNNGAPDAQYNRARGTFQETLTGMHKTPILMHGSFLLNRVSTITELNPAVP